MNYLLRRVIDLLGALSGLYYRRKYSLIARRMGRSESVGELAGKGFIIIQIDGLAYEHLLEAMRKGYTPFLHHLIQEGRMKLARWRSGLPSTTPAVQAGIMFGHNFDIPGFRWYEKDKGMVITFKAPGPAKLVQDRISAQGEGILRGGSSYVNLLDGGAYLSLFTLGAINSGRFFESVRGLGFFLLVALNPWRVLRILFLPLWECLLRLLRQVRSFVRSDKSCPEVSLVSLFQVFVDVLFRELQTFGVMVDIYRGVPAIYANYTSYDEMAHHCGATSHAAFRALRQIDKHIRQIDRIRTLYRRREYDLYILSDHGVTPSVPFSRLYGYALGDYIAREAGLVAHEASGAEQHWAVKAHFLLTEWEQRRESPHSSFLGRAARRFLEEHAPLERESDWDLHKRLDVMVMNSGPLSHVYFNVAPRPLELGEIAALYPGLVRKLVEHPGIGLVVARDGKDVVVMGKKGVLILGEEERLEGENPLASLEEPEAIAEQIRYLASFPHSGDLILFGAWWREGTEEAVVSFEEQEATHGGLGGPQFYPFIVYPRTMDLSVEEVTNARQLYGHFMRVYLDRGKEDKPAS